MKTANQHNDLLARLRKVEPDGGTEHSTRWYRNPDGPEAAELIERMSAADHMNVEKAWRPIEDAPHGVEVLLATPPFECMGKQAKWEFRVGRASWGERIGGFSNRSMDAHATHWMPLPPAPISHEKEN